MTQISRSALVPAALLAGLCPLIANSLYEDFVGDGAQILSEAAADPPLTARVSVALFLLGFAALIVTLGLLAAAIAGKAPALAGVVVVAGATSVAIKIGEAQTGLALRESAGVVDAGTAEVLVGMDEAGFAVYGFLLSIALGAAGLGLLQTRVFPAWLAWWPVVMGGLGVLTAAIGIVVPPNYMPLPFILLLLWLVVLGLTAVRQPLIESVPERPAAVTQ